MYNTLGFTFSKWSTLLMVGDLFFFSISIPLGYWLGTQEGEIFVTGNDFNGSDTEGRAERIGTAGEWLEFLTRRPADFLPRN